MSALKSPYRISAGWYTTALVFMCIFFGTYALSTKLDSMEPQEAPQRNTTEGKVYYYVQDCSRSGGVVIPLRVSQDVLQLNCEGGSMRFRKHTIY